MKVVFKKFRAILIILGILVVWTVLEAILYAIFGKGAITIIIGIGITFVIGACFFYAIKKVWKK